MLKRTLLTAVVGFAPLAALAAGCQSSSNANRPYSLTGTSAMSEQERKEQLRWTDEKGHYRPDLRQRGGAPLRDIP